MERYRQQGVWCKSRVRSIEKFSRELGEKWEGRKWLNARSGGETAALQAGTHRIIPDTDPVSRVDSNRRRAPDPVAPGSRYQH